MHPRGRKIVQERSRRGRAGGERELGGTAAATGERVQAVAAGYGSQREMPGRAVAVGAGDHAPHRAQAKPRKPVGRQPLGTPLQPRQRAGAVRARIPDVAGHPEQHLAAGSRAHRPPSRSAGRTLAEPGSTASSSPTRRRSSPGSGSAQTYTDPISWYCAHRLRVVLAVSSTRLAAARRLATGSASNPRTRPPEASVASGAPAPVNTSSHGAVRGPAVPGVRRVWLASRQASKLPARPAPTIAIRMSFIRRLPGTAVGRPRSVRAGAGPGRAG